MRVTETSLPGVLLIEPAVHEDARGFFLETYRERDYRERGMRARFVQDNHSRSVRGVLRGLHYQRRRPQTKLCRVSAGAVLDVVVDIRLGSPTFGRAVIAELSEANRRQIYVPAGLAHGFAALSETADFLYKCDADYDPNDERGVRWDDPGLNLDWGLADPILNERDRRLPRLDQIPEADLPRWIP